MSSLYYQSFGNSTLKDNAVILCHGLFGMSDNLLGLAKELSGGYWVIVPDLINHGRSPHRASMSFRDMAEDILALMDELAIDKAVLLGHSLGGKVVLQLASLYPERVTALIIADIAPVEYPPHHALILDAMLRVADTTILQRKQAEAILAESIDDKALIPFFMKSLERQEDGTWGWRIGLREIVASYDQLRQAPEKAHLYQGRVLFIKGEKSSYIQASHQQAIESYCSNVSMKIIQGAGHWLHAEKPKAFNRLVIQFIAECKGEEHVQD